MDAMTAWAALRKAQDEQVAALLIRDSDGNPQGENGEAG